MTTYYWVGGAGTWDATTTTHWATSSGGAGSAGVPTATDNVIFNSASNGAAYAVTIVTGAVCNDCTATAPATGALTFSGTGTLVISGSWSSVATMSLTGTMTFNSSNTGNTIQVSANPACSIIFNGTGSWTLLSNFAAAGPLKSIIFTQGTLNLNNFWLGGYNFNSNNTNTRTINFDTSGYIYYVSTLGQTTNLTWNFTNFTATGSKRINLSVTGTSASNNPGFSFYNATEENSFNIDFTGSTNTISIFRIYATGSTGVRDLDLSAYTGNIYDISTLDLPIYGNLILRASTTSYYGISPIMSSTDAITKKIDFNGRTTSANFGNGLIILGGGSAGGGSFISANTINVTSSATKSLNICGGIFNSNNFNVITNKLNLSSSNTRQIIMGSGEWKINTNDNGTISWDCTNSTNLTVTKNTATINISTYTSSISSNTIFSGGNTSWPTIKNSCGLTTLVINGSNSFDNIQKSGANTNITFEAGTTTSVSGMDINGVSGSLSNISSTISGTRYTLTKIGGGAINTYYLGIKDSIATGGTWNAYTTNGNIDYGNNSGWNFSIPIGTFNPGFLSFFDY